MIQKNSPSHDQESNQFALSYEVLCLLQWLIDTKAEKLKQMIAQGFKDGQLRHKMAANAKNDEAQYSLIEFFSLLEELLIEVSGEQAVQKAIEKNLMPAIDQIDATICNDETVQMSIARATAKMERRPHENPKELLFKEILKQWKPDKKKLSIH